MAKDVNNVDHVLGNFDTPNSNLIQRIDCFDVPQVLNYFDNLE